MKIAFRDSLHLNKTNISRLAEVNNIIKDYAQEGYKLTLRQLYYQLVVKEIIPNLQVEYAKLSGLLVKGRMAGHIDYDKSNLDPDNLTTLCTQCNLRVNWQKDYWKEFFNERNAIGTKVS